MPITILCPHDKTELVLVPDKKTPDGLLKCPKCGCTFRVCLAIFDHKCFSKIHPKTEWKADKKQIMTIEDSLKAIEKKKRGRPKKNEKIIEEEIDKEQKIKQDKIPKEKVEV